MQYNVTRLNEFGRNTQSPTMAMFSDWGQKNHTIVELFVLLSKMQHYRALEILMPYGTVFGLYLEVYNILKITLFVDQLMKDTMSYSEMEN
jgi:hypothetical protein